MSGNGPAVRCLYRGDLREWPHHRAPKKFPSFGSSRMLRILHLVGGDTGVEPCKLRESSPSFCLLP
jgi:hypothetical protein